MLESQPNNVLALNNLAWVSGQLKDPKALEYAEKADKLAPNNPAILDTLGMLLVEKGDTQARHRIAAEGGRACARMPPSIRLNLARALVKDGQKDAAKKELETLAKLGDKFPAPGRGREADEGAVIDELTAVLALANRCQRV